MRNLTALLFSCVLASGQQRPQQATPVIQAQPQVATTIVLTISADLATALETARLNVRSTVTDPKTGVSTTAPTYPSIQVFVDALTRGPGGIFAQVINKYPPPSIKAAQDVAAEKIKAAQSAAEEAVAPKK